ncbi:Gfo/Idh/MocA family oxidoreductase [uncultured Gilvimarinus sp.]|jgi:predicted dehydrogenase|uniref:Gfo/Idh/MocA family protein n=1 Tax=uncultured Gilvimarinus sp. TaxID=1689143 RepID=UPI0030D9C550
MRYVIVGTGNISNTYVSALGKLAGCELVGAVSRSGRALAAAPDLPIWPSLAAVDRAFDAVILATPNGLHHQGAIAAAELGKHVLTEKPLDIAADAMATMTAACKKAGVTLAVCYQRRTRPDNIAIKRLIDEGTLGQIYAADLSAKFYRDQAYYDSGDYRGGYSLDGGGPFMQQACHNLDIYTWLFGLPQQVVSMLGTFAHDIESEDHGAALLRHANGMIGTVVASTAAKPGFAARLEVHTEKGSFTLTDDVITQWHVDNLDNPAQPGKAYHHDGATSAAVTDTTAHEAIIKDFEQAVEDNREPLAGADSAKLTTELILKIYNSQKPI